MAKSKVKASVCVCVNSMGEERRGEERRGVSEG